MRGALAMDCQGSDPGSSCVGKSLNLSKTPFTLLQNGHVCSKGLTLPMERFGSLPPAPERQILSSWDISPDK